MTVQARSQRLLSFLTASAGVSAPWFACPAGYVVLVKSFHAYNSNASVLGYARMQLAFSSGTPFALVELDNIPATGPAEWNGWMVLHPTDLLTVYASNSGVYIAVFGAVVHGPNQFPPSGG